MDENCLSITGKIVGRIKVKVAVNGVKHHYFWLEHCSDNQIEAGMQRNVYCRLLVVLSEQSPSDKSACLQYGNHVKIVGFVAFNKDKREQNRLILHANTIELI